MYLIKDELINNANRLKISIRILSSNDTINILGLLKSKYVNNCKVNGNFLWENIANPVYLNDPLGWSYIGNFIDDVPCLIIFNDFDSWVAIEISNGVDLTQLLSESYGFEFYVINQELTYVICFNHHDQLICAGEAEKWLNDYKDETI